MGLNNAVDFQNAGTNAMGAIELAIQKKDHVALARAIELHSSFEGWLAGSQHDTVQADANEFYRVVMSLETDLFDWLDQYSEILPETLKQAIDAESIARI